jgi:hypothetical protein
MAWRARERKNSYLAPLIGRGHPYLAQGEGTENDGTPLDVLASVATFCLVQSHNFSGHHRCEQCGSVSDGELVHSLAVKSSADLKDCEKSFHESESPADYQLLGCSKSTSIKASGSGNMDEKKNNEFTPNHNI